MLQAIYPDIETGFGNELSRVAPIGEFSAGKVWNIDGKEGDVFRIDLTRDPLDPTEISVTWVKTGSRPVGEVKDRYFMSGIFNGESAEGYEMKYDDQSKAYKAEIPMYIIPTPFNIVVNKKLNLRVHPDKKDCSQI